MPLKSRKSHNFTYQANQSLQSPFTPPADFGTTHLLRTLTDQELDVTHTFTYGANNASSTPNRGLAWRLVFRGESRSPSCPAGCPRG